MEIEMVKDPFEYRRFKHILIFDNTKLTNNDAEILGSKICSQLNKETKMGWKVETCVGNKCTLMSRLIPQKEKRKKWKGEKITVDNHVHIK